MTGYLLDTNVLAEEIRPQPNPNLQAWTTRNRAQSYTTAINVAELAFGVRRLSTGRRRSALEHWLSQLVEAFEGRILSFNERTAFAWAELQSELERQGRRMSVQDGYIAAIARRHGLTIATRNVRDFQRAGIKIENPFTV